ncbi:MAG TPA: NAD(P)/FAD-dependent oxidoreductase [Nevskiaceae bacterium]|nr:NAD(P)/FAD-dependent oxidoreductase [Nevskiaceae bacterium]
MLAMNIDYDILVIGAGLSGIGMACQLQREFPGKRLTILERRNAIGGTWDLFRYPGIRSDSDMFTFGYQFRPWNALKVLADGPSIRKYIADTAAEYGVDRKIQFGVKIVSADWSSDARCWTIRAVHESTGEPRAYTAKYVVNCTGYFNHDQGFLPKFAGIEQFKGQCVHPQQWPEDLDYSGKKVVIIGSGATAVTLVPAMAGKASHVTMLQRSPTYIFSIPALDKISGFLAKFLPAKWVFGAARRRQIALQRWIYAACRLWPKLTRRLLLAQTRRHLGDGFDMGHFTPKYMPWDERLCMVPDADLFAALKSKQASVVTDHIDTFTESGIRLKSGQTLDADIVVTATGLQLQMLGGMTLSVDGRVVSFSDQMTYKSMLIQDVPNMAFIFGYTNASWTLKVDIAAAYLIRLFRHMDANGVGVATPRDLENCALGTGMLDSLQSGYVQRSMQIMPRQGSKLPWRVLMNYQRDRKMLVDERIEDGVLAFR